MSSFDFIYPMPLWQNGPSVDVEGTCHVRETKGGDWVLTAIVIDDHDLLQNANNELFENIIIHIQDAYDDAAREAAHEEAENARIAYEESRGELV